MANPTSQKYCPLLVDGCPTDEPTDEMFVFNPFIPTVPYSGRITGFVSLF